VPHTRGVTGPYPRSGRSARLPQPHAIYGWRTTRRTADRMREKVARTSACAIHSVLPSSHSLPLPLASTLLPATHCPPSSPPLSVAVLLLLFMVLTVRSPGPPLPISSSSSLSPLWALKTKLTTICHRTASIISVLRRLRDHHHTLQRYRRGSRASRRPGCLIILARTFQTSPGSRIVRGDARCGWCAGRMPFDLGL